MGNNRKKEAAESAVVKGDNPLAEDAPEDPSSEKSTSRQKDWDDLVEKKRHIVTVYNTRRKGLSRPTRFGIG
jgi:hypothetical protein